MSQGAQLLVDGKPNDDEFARHQEQVDLIMQEMEEAQDEEIVLKRSPTTLELSCCETFLFYLANILLGILSLGLVFCGGFYTVQQMNACIITSFGKILHVEFEPGLRFFTSIGTEKIHVSLRVRDMNVRGSNCPDVTGSPLQISSIVTYSITDPVKAVWHLAHMEGYLTN